MPADQGWVRDPQRFPVRIMILPKDARDAGIDVGRSGAQANVIIFTDDQGYADVGVMPTEGWGSLVGAVAGLWSSA